MPRYDLVDNDESAIEFALVDYSVRKERRKRRWGWLIGFIGLVAILAAYAVSNPAVVQQYAADIPALLTSLQPSAASPQADAVTENGITENQDADSAIQADEAEPTAVPVEESVDVEMADASDEDADAGTEVEAESTAVDAVAENADANEEQPETEEAGALTLVNVDPANVDTENVEPATTDAGNTTSTTITSNNPVAYSGTLLQDSSGSLSVVGADGSSVFDAPAGNLLTILTPGTIVSVSGRTGNDQWLMTSMSDGTTGWVAAGSLVIFGLDNLPVTSDSMAEGIGQPVSAGGSDTVAQVAVATPVPTIVPSPIPSITPSPTLAPTFTSTPEPTLLQLPTASSGPDSINTVFAVVRSRGTELLATQDGETIRSLRSGFTLNAIGRSDDGAWLQVTTTDGEVGWVGTDRVVVFRVSSLPIVGADGRVIGPAGNDVAGGISNGSDTNADVAEASSGQNDNAAAGQSGTGSGSTTSQPSVASGSAAAARPTPINSDGLPIVSIIATGARLNIRSGPDSTYEIIGKALTSEQFVALGRSEDSEWIQIEVLDVPGEFGWVSASFVALNESIFGLPQSNQVNFSADVYRESLDARPANAAPVAAAANQPIATLPATNLASATPIPPVAQSAVSVASLPAPSVAESSAPAAAAAGLSGKLVFQESLGGNIYVYDFASSTLRTLSVGMDPAISPDGSKVTFSRFGGDGGIYTVDINGANEQRIYVDTTVRSPKWSPDGNWIVFSRLTGEYACRNIGFGICLENNPLLSQVTLDTKEERGLTRIDPQGDNFRDLAALNTAYTPDWNENGVVYQAVTSIEITEDKSDADTVAVLKQTIGFQDPDWQPNGGRIIFQGQQGSHWEIFSVQPDGGGLQALTKPITALVDVLPSNVSPAWSPDGQHIAYVSNRAAGEEAGAWRLWVMNADGSNKRALPINVDLEYAFNKEQMVSWGL